jgi:hypothetical protein
MKKFFGGLLLSAVMATAALWVTPAKAQDARVYATVLNGGTNGVLAATTKTYTGITVACSDYDQVGVQITWSGSASAAGNNTVKIAESQDGTTYESTPKYVLTVPVNGTNVLTYCTNLSVASARTLKFVSVQNSNASDTITGVSVKWSFKNIKRNTSR